MEGPDSDQDPCKESGGTGLSYENGRQARGGAVVIWPGSAAIGIGAVVVMAAAVGGCAETSPRRVDSETAVTTCLAGLRADDPAIRMVTRPASTHGSDGLWTVTVDVLDGGHREHARCDLAPDGEIIHTSVAD